MPASHSGRRPVSVEQAHSLHLVQGVTVEEEVHFQMVEDGAAELLRKAMVRLEAGLR